MKLIGERTFNGFYNTLSMVKVAVKEYGFDLEKTEEKGIPLYKCGEHKESTTSHELGLLASSKEDLEVFSNFVENLAEFFCEYEEEEGNNGYPGLLRLFFELLENHISYHYFDSESIPKVDIFGEGEEYDYFLVEISLNELKNLEKMIDKWRELKQETSAPLHELRKLQELLVK